MYRNYRIWPLLAFLVIPYQISSCYESEIINSIISISASLELTVNYYIREISTFNFDGLFGILALSASLNKFNYSSEFIDSQIYHSIVNLTSLAREAKKMAISQLSNIKNYQKNLNFLFFRSYIPLKHKLYTESIESSSYSFPKLSKNRLLELELVSDLCLSALHDIDNNFCRLSPDCYSFIYDNDTESYYSTHQFLFLYILKQSNCWSIFDKYTFDHIRLSADQLFKKIASHIFLENSKLKVVDYIKADLYSEQVWILTLYGYTEAAFKMNVSRTLEFQKSTGCYSSTGDIIVSSAPYSRKPLSEHLNSDGCLSHLTAVSVLSLASVVYMHSIHYTSSKLVSWYSFNQELTRYNDLNSILEWYSISSPIEPLEIFRIPLIISVIVVIIILCYLPRGYLSGIFIRLFPKKFYK